jgi:opacity protein-like surface antigen
LLTTALVAPTVAATSVLLAGPAVAQDDPFNWSGFYFGGGVGIVESRGSQDLAYDDGGLISGWTSDDGAFTGDIFRTVDLAGVAAGSANPYDLAYDDYNISLDNMADWATTADTSGTEAFGTVFGGGQWQVPDASLVLGGELRANFGSFGSSSVENWTATSTDSGSAECETNSGDCLVASLLPGLVLTDWDVSYPNGNVTGSTIDSGDDVTITGTVNQNNTMSFGTSFDKSFSALARVGVPVERALIYGLAGPTVARVTASTSATVEESGTIVLQAEDRTATYSNSETYQWDGSVSENRVGFTFGAGVDYAVTDNILLRGEVSYTNLGSISVTGTSADTSSTYTVSQHIGSAQALAGVMFKF